MSTRSWELHVALGWVVGRPARIPGSRPIHRSAVPKTLPGLLSFFLPRRALPLTRRIKVAHFARALRLLGALFLRCSLRSPHTR